MRFQAQRNLGPSVTRTELGSWHNLNNMYCATAMVWHGGVRARSADDLGVNSADARVMQAPWNLETLIAQSWTRLCAVLHSEGAEDHVIVHCVSLRVDAWTAPPDTSKVNEAVQSPMEYFASSHLVSIRVQHTWDVYNMKACAIT
jgi:hypothetical protein